MEEVKNLENQNDEAIGVYIKLNSNNEIVEICSHIFITDLSGWVFVDKGHGDRYAHAQSQYLQHPILKDGKFNYVYEKGEITKK